MDVQYVLEHLGRIASDNESRYWWYIKVNWAVH